VGGRTAGLVGGHAVAAGRSLAGGPHPPAGVGKEGLSIDWSRDVRHRATAGARPSRPSSWPSLRLHQRPMTSVAHSLAALWGLPRASGRPAAALTGLSAYGLLSSNKRPPGREEFNRDVGGGPTAAPATGATAPWDCRRREFGAAVGGRFERLDYDEHGRRGGIRKPWCSRPASTLYLLRGPEARALRRVQGPQGGGDAAAPRHRRTRPPAVKPAFPLLEPPQGAGARGYSGQPWMTNGVDARGRRRPVRRRKPWRRATRKNPSCPRPDGTRTANAGRFRFPSGR